MVFEIAHFGDGKTILSRDVRRRSMLHNVAQSRGNSEDPDGDSPTGQWFPGRSIKQKEVTMLESIGSSTYFNPAIGSADLPPQPWSSVHRPVSKKRTVRTAATDLRQRYPEAIAASSDKDGWQNLRLLHLRHGLDWWQAPASDSHCLALNLGAPIRLRVQCANREFEGIWGTGEVAIIPADSSWECSPDGSRVSNVILLFLRPLFVRSTAAELDLAYPDHGLTPQIGFRNSNIRHVALSLLYELKETNIDGRLYADSLAPGLALQLVAQYSSLNGVQLGQGGMAPFKLRKAVGLIDRHLTGEEEGRVALREVAREVNMSYFHFSRAFKQSMGMNPTNYIAARRIQRAKELLNQTELPISEIALRTGFSSQSHFTTSFRRLAGSTPRDFRAAI